jgi:hypothetical protein
MASLSIGKPREIRAGAIAGTSADNFVWFDQTQCDLGKTGGFSAEISWKLFNGEVS